MPYYTGGSRRFEDACPTGDMSNKYGYLPRPLAATGGARLFYVAHALPLSGGGGTDWACLSDVDTAFLAADADADGKLSRSELTRALGGAVADATALFAAAGVGEYETLTELALLACHECVEALCA